MSFLDLFRRKALNPVPQRGGGGWLNVVREPFTGAWQRNMELSRETVLAQATVFACITLIAGDIAKQPWRLRQNVGDIWKTVSNPAYDPVLRSPNHYQNDQQFRESWMLSKLMNGNTLALKIRDSRNVVKSLRILNWNLVQPLVTDSGEVFYRVNKDALADQYEDEVIIPASEVIHDRFNTFFHPLIGLSPLYAAAATAGHSLHIQSNTTSFFGNGARPSGILTAPGALTQEKAAKLKETWDSAFSGENAGRVAVLADGLTFIPMQMTSTDAQLIEQLRWDAEEICRVFHVPGYMVGVGAEPSYNNAQSTTLRYYTTGLQPLMEAMERCMGDGLGLASNLEVHLSTESLLRMDSVTQTAMLVQSVGGKLMTPNEGRASLNLPPVKGGDAIYAQQQDHSLAALAERDAQQPLVEAPAPAPAAEPAADPAEQKALLDLFRKSVGLD